MPYETQTPNLFAPGEFFDPPPGHQLEIEGVAPQAVGLGETAVEHTFNVASVESE